jgi:hypothetical protein
MDSQKTPIFLQSFLQPDEYGSSPYRDDGDYAIDLRQVHSSTGDQVNHAIEVFADVYEILSSHDCAGAFYDFVLAMEKLSAANSTFVPSRINNDQKLVLDLLEKSGLIASFHIPNDSTVYTRTASGDRFFSQAYAYMKHVFALENFSAQTRYVNNWSQILTLNFIRCFLIPRVKAKLAAREFQKICREVKEGAYGAIFGSQPPYGVESAEA